MPCAPQMTLPCVDLTTVAAVLLSGLLVILPYYAMVSIANSLSNADTIRDTKKREMS